MLTEGESNKKQVNQPSRTPERIRNVKYQVPQKVGKRKGAQNKGIVSKTI